MKKASNSAIRGILYGFNQRCKSCNCLMDLSFPKPGETQLDNLATIQHHYHSGHRLRHKVVRIDLFCKKCNVDDGRRFNLDSPYPEIELCGTVAIFCRESDIYKIKKGESLIGYISAEKCVLQSFPKMIHRMIEICLIELKKIK